MRRQLVLILVLGVFAAATTFAQQPKPYNQLMKDVQATFASLKKNLDATGPQAPAQGARGAAPESQAAKTPSEEEIQKSADAAIQDAAKLEGLFKEVEAFWAQFNTQDAVRFAKDAQTSAAAVATAARAHDFKAAQTSYTAVQRNCGGCHFTHREETQKGFLIRP